MNDGPFEIQYELTDAQVRRAAWSFWWRRYAWVGLVMSGVCLSYALVLSFLTHFSAVIATVFYTLAAYQLLFTVGGFHKFTQAIQEIRAKAESKLVTMGFSDAGVSIHAELFTASYKWRVFTGLWRCRDLLLLIIAGSSYHAIPRAAVSPELSDYIGRCLSASRGGRSICRECGYDLRGLTEPRCPECGTRFDADILKIKR
jgi:hypothetical protein